MSDFLSKFNKNQYDDLINEQENKKKNNDVDKQPDQSEKINEQNDAGISDEQKETERVTIDEQSRPPDLVTSRRTEQREVEENIEIDPDYKRKRRLQLWFIIVGSALACLLIFFIYHAMVHVKVEDFVGEPVSEARTWTNENDVEIELVQEYDMDYHANEIISQSVAAGDKIRKGKTLKITSSLGPDPEEVIPLADFSEMSQEQAENWIDENKAENVQMVTEYNDDIEAGEFIKLTIRDSGIDASSYQRKDSAAVYYSRGQEVFEQNITIPDFVGSAREEVEKWTETNEIEMTYEESDSDHVEVGYIISQNQPAEEKIAKREKMTVVVSVGQAIVVPNFAELTAEEATSHYPDLDVHIKQLFHADISYGRIISQSVEAGTKLTEQDNKQVTVVYSQGRPYLKDFRGYLEGDLPQLFFDEYQSKGANVNYIVKFVDSYEIKGTVVSMGVFNQFVPMTYTVEVRISNNTSAPPEPPTSIEPEINPPFIEEELIEK